MDYITVAEAARRWGVTVRLVQGYCARGRVDGAEKFSGSWRIPADAPKPRDLPCGGSAADRGWGAASASIGGLMPLMNTPFAPGGARAAVEGLADGARRDIACPDGLIEPLAEHHGLLGGMLEAAIKPAWPDDFRRIIDITYRFSAGWRRVHNPATGDDVADNLATTEFAACMLAARGWSNAEIAAHMGISPNTVKSYVSAALRKLGITRRRDPSRIMLS